MENLNQSSTINLDHHSLTGLKQVSKAQINLMEILINHLIEQSVVEQ
jgi:hypothetical protein